MHTYWRAQRLNCKIPRYTTKAFKVREAPVPASRYNHHHHHHHHRHIQ